MTNLTLTFPTPARERAQLRAIEARNTRGSWPKVIEINSHDHGMLSLNMRRHGYHNGKPLDVFNVPIVVGDVARGAIRFVWE